MPAIGKPLRAKMLSVLSDEATGFNARIAAIADSYGIAAPVIDWAAGSKTFHQAYLDPSQTDISQITGYEGDGTEVAVSMYTRGLVPAQGAKGRKFTGTAQLEVDFWIRTHDLEKDSSIEDLCDAIVDAFLEAVCSDSIAWGSFHFNPNHDFSFPKEPAALMEDGTQQRIPFVLTFGVEV